MVTTLCRTSMPRFWRYTILRKPGIPTGQWPTPLQSPGSAAANRCPRSVSTSETAVSIPEAYCSELNDNFMKYYVLNLLSNMHDGFQAMCMRLLSCYIYFCNGDHTRENSKTRRVRGVKLIALFYHTIHHFE